MTIREEFRAYLREEEARELNEASRFDKKEREKYSELLRKYIKNDMDVKSVSIKKVDTKYIYITSNDNEFNDLKFAINAEGLQHNIVDRQQGDKYISVSFELNQNKIYNTLYSSW